MRWRAYGGRFRKLDWSPYFLAPSKQEPALVIPCTGLLLVVVSPLWHHAAGRALPTLVRLRRVAAPGGGLRIVHDKRFTHGTDYHLL